MPRGRFYDGCIERRFMRSAKRGGKVGLVFKILLSSPLDSGQLALYGPDPVFVGIKDYDIWMKDA